MTQIAVILLLLGFGASYVMITPQLKRNRQNVEKVLAQEADLDRDIARLRAASAQLATAKETFTSQKGVDFNKLPTILPPTEDLPGLYLQMEALKIQAARDGVVSPTYQIAAPLPNPTEGNVHIPVTWSGTGSYDTVKKLLTLLEQNLRPLSIDNLSLTQTVTKDSKAVSGQLTVSITAIVRARGFSSAYAAAATP
jgi:hypothetical protein